MRRVAIAVAVIGFFAMPALAEDLSPPPWDQSLGFPETWQIWDFPTILATSPQGAAVPSPMEPSDHLTNYPETRIPYIEWPSGQMDIDDPDDPGNIITLYYSTNVDIVDYVNPDGITIEDTPTVHISIEKADGTPLEGTPLAGVTVPVAIWIPNSPDPNLVKKIFWQMTSDKSPTPTGSPPTTNPPGTNVPTTIPQYQHDASTWYTYNGMIEIQPNPDGEWLIFELVDSTNIEEIVIKTICMPEPATLALLGTGGLLMVVVRRRRRR